MLTCGVGVAVVVHASPGYGLTAKQRITVKVVAEFFQEAENVGDTADGGQSQGVLLLVEVRYTGQTTSCLIPATIATFYKIYTVYHEIQHNSHRKWLRHLVQTWGRRRL